MPLDARLLHTAQRAAERAAACQRDADAAKAEYHHAIRRLQLSGATMREIADALNLSHQRVQQIVDARGGGRPWTGRRPHSPDMLVCSFCGTDRRRVTQLIAGPGIYICRRCVEDAREITRGGQPPTRLTGLVAVGHRQSARCGFCGKNRSKVKHLIMMGADRVALPKQAKYGTVSICNKCLDLCNEIIEQPNGS
jgi:ClpX C4-type zinc finger